MIPEGAIALIVLTAAFLGSVLIPAKVRSEGNTAGAIFCAALLWPSTLILCAVLYKMRHAFGF